MLSILSFISWMRYIQFSHGRLSYVFMFDFQIPCVKVLKWSKKFFVQSVENLKTDDESGLMIMKLKNFFFFSLYTDSRYIPALLYVLRRGTRKVASSVFFFFFLCAPKILALMFIGSLHIPSIHICSIRFWYITITSFVGVRDFFKISPHIGLPLVFLPLISWFTFLTYIRSSKLD